MKKTYSDISNYLFYCMSVSVCYPVIPEAKEKSNETSETLYFDLNLLKVYLNLTVSFAVTSFAKEIFI